MHMDDGAKRSRLPRRRPAKEVHLENLHADISRLITSDSRQAGGQEAGRRWERSRGHKPHGRRDGL